MVKGLIILLFVAVVAVLLVSLNRPVVHPHAYVYHGPDPRLRLDKHLGWVIQLPIPDPYVDVFGEHVSAMQKAGYFERLASRDLWHGHLLMGPGAKDEYESVADMLKDTAMVLYHSAEFAGRWERQSNLPMEKRTPRSIIGFWDGAVVPAITLVDPKRAELLFYKSNGTVSDSDLWATHPEWFECWPSTKTIRLGPRAKCRAELQFLILHDPWGRLHLDDVNYDIYLRCQPDPRELGLEGYDVRPRNFVLDGQ